MTVYSVRNKITGDTRLVEAANNAQARKHVADDLFEVSVPTQKDVFLLAGKGVELETYGDTGQDELPDEENEADASAE